MEIPYGSTLEAKLPLVPSVDTPNINDEDLVFLSSSNADAQAIDVALMAMNNPGASADVDHLHCLVEQRTHLQTRECQLEKEKYDLHIRWQTVT